MWSKYLSACLLVLKKTKQHTTVFLLKMTKIPQTCVKLVAHDEIMFKGKKKLYI